MTNDETCGTCRHRYIDKNDIKTGYCRLNPPTLIVTMPQRPGGPPGFGSTHPPVHSSYPACSHYSPKTSLVQ